MQSDSKGCEQDDIACVRVPITRDCATRAADAADARTLVLNGVHESIVEPGDGFATSWIVDVSTLAPEQRVTVASLLLLTDEADADGENDDTVCTVGMLPTNAAITELVLRASRIHNAADVSGNDHVFVMSDEDVAILLQYTDQVASGLVDAGIISALHDMLVHGCSLAKCIRGYAA